MKLLRNVILIVGYVLLIGLAYIIILRHSKTAIRLSDSCNCSTASSGMTKVQVKRNLEPVTPLPQTQKKARTNFSADHGTHIIFFGPVT